MKLSASSGVAAGLGFRKFRLTGGELLVRHDILDIVHGMKEIPGVDVIGLSTNGPQALLALAKPLCEAGVTGGEHKPGRAGPGNFTGG